MLTALLTLGVVLVPGALLALAVPPGRDRWAVLTTAPALTYGLVTLGMAWLPRTPLPDSAVAVLVLELAVALAAATLGVLTRRRRLPETTAGRTFPRWGDLLAVTLPAVVGSVFGLSIFRGLVATPGWDGQNHGFMVRQIIDTGHATIAAACTSGSTLGVSSCQFYPLAANVSWAQAAVLGSGAVSTAMTVTSAVVAPLSLAIGTFGLVRWMGARPAVASAAATAAVFIGPFWTTMLSGRVTEQLGPALSPACALLGIMAVRSCHRLLIGLMAGLAMAGLLMTHTYQAVFAGVLGLAAALVGQAVTGGRTVPSGKARGVVLGVLAGAAGIALTLGPLAVALAEAKGERIAVGPAFEGQWGTAAHYWLTSLKRYVPLGYPNMNGTDYPLVNTFPRTVTLITAATMLLAIPGSLTRAVRWVRPWVATWAVFTAIGIWAAVSTTGPARTIASLWYGTDTRLFAMISPVYGVMAVGGLATGGHLLALAWCRLRRGRGDSTPARWPASVLAAAFALSLVAVVSTTSERGPLADGLRRHGPQGPAYDRVFTWLREHTHGDQVVAWDRNGDYMSWANADEGVPALFGIPPLIHQGPGTAVSPNYAEFARRYAAFWWLTDKPGIAPQGCQVRHYDIAYLTVARPAMPRGWYKPTYDLARLRASPKLHLVHKDGGIEVYAVTAAGRACAGS